ncbi:MAG: T9SS type A sorting domain-containing protein, partial [Chitinophagales bacterium]|nr:T9SS type A sorting domain-containing protein [Chitinophagales bacterium]
FGVTDKYLGLRLDMSGDNHYGWARLDVSDDGKTLTVKDYAYEATAETEIAAGATGTIGINSPAENAINVFTMEHQIYVQLNKGFNGLITVSNLVGQQIKAAEITGSMTTMNLNDQPAGVYLVTVDQDGALFTKKVTLL